VVLGVAPMLQVKLQERRRRQRHELALPGRCMLRDRREYPCWTVDVSSIGLGVTGLQKGDVGERIIAYISQIGRIEGTIARLFAKGFALEIHAPPHKQEKLAKRIEWLANREATGARDEREHERFPADQQQTSLRTPDGREYAAALLDVSIPGAALNVEAAPPIGSPVVVGQTSARVVRHFPGGIAVSFDERLAEQALRERARL
jgi:hypothetical protein